MNCHLHNLKLKHGTLQYENAEPAKLAEVAAEYRRLYAGWRASLVAELVQLQSEELPDHRDYRPAKRIKRQKGTGRHSYQEQQGDETVSPDRIMGKPRAVSELEALIKLLDDKHEDSRVSQQNITNVFAPPKPFYMELTRDAQIVFWKSVVGKDEIYRFYRPLNKTVAIVENLEQSPFSRSMEMSLVFVRPQPVALR